MEHGLIQLIILIVVVGVLGGIAIVLIRKAPFMDGMLKQAAEWLVWLVMALIILSRVLPLAGINL